MRDIAQASHEAEDYEYSLKILSEAEGLLKKKDETQTEIKADFVRIL